MIEKAIAKLAERNAGGMQAKHYKMILKCLQYKRVFPSELILLSGLGKQEAMQTLQELKEAGFLQFDGDKYFIKDCLELLNELIDKAEEEVIVEAVRKSRRIQKAVIK